MLLYKFLRLNVVAFGRHNKQSCTGDLFNGKKHA